MVSSTYHKSDSLSSFLHPRSPFMWILKIITYKDATVASIQI